MYIYLFDILNILFYNICILLLENNINCLIIFRNIYIYCYEKIIKNHITKYKNIWKIIGNIYINIYIYMYIYIDICIDICIEI